MAELAARNLLFFSLEIIWHRYEYTSHAYPNYHGLLCIAHAVTFYTPLINFFYVQ